MKKRILSLLMALVLVTGLLPGPVLAEDAPFTAAAGETALTVVKSDTAYVYTVTEYDADWNPVSVTEQTADLYVITVPAGIDSVTLTFDAPRLAYGYDAGGNYTASYGEYGDGTTGRTTAAVSGGFPEYVRVQTPYDSGWNSRLLYAVRFDLEEGGQNRPTGADNTWRTIADTIAAAHTDVVGDWWWAAGMSSYAALTGGTENALTDTAKQTIVDTVVQEIGENPASSNCLANAINALSALGLDPADITAADGTRLNAVELLKQVDVASEKTGSWAWLTVPPYVLLACNQGVWETDALEAEIIAFLLENAEETGGWSTAWGVDTTAMVLQGLAPYYDSNSAVKAAVDQAVAVLSDKQEADGGYGNVNSDAMVILALSALGIDPASDTRFVKNGLSAADHLLGLFSNGSFGNDYAEKQGFLAAVALCALADGADAYNVFDFSDGTKLPTTATADSGASGGGEISPDPQTITVSFTLQTQGSTWVELREVTVSTGASVADVFFRAARETGFSYENRNGYIASITYNGTTWSEFDAGPNSGWKYMVNGVAPAVGMNDCAVSDGDAVVWYYVTDYTQDTARDEQTMGPETAAPVFTDMAEHWAASAVDTVCALGLMDPAAETLFAPDDSADRLTIVTALYRLSGGDGGDPVAWAVENGILTGYGDGVLGTADPVTREQLAVFLYRYAGLQGLDGTAGTGLSGFADSGEVSPWAAEAMAWAVDKGLICGTSAAALSPGETATRAQMAVILSRWLETA